MKGYTGCLYNLLKGVRDSETLSDIHKTFISGLNEGYHHTALRLLQVFIPYMVFMGMRGKAITFINVAIDTAKTSKNRFMNEWFMLYKWAVEGFEADILKRKLRFYIKNRSIYHTLMAHYLLNGSNDKIRKYIDKYWHTHTHKFISTLREG